MATPSPLLLQSLEKRPLAPSGLLDNDRPIPVQFADWQARGGFWGKVSAYYIQKHQGMASVYTSPFRKMDEKQNAWDGKEKGLAERYFEGLGWELRAKVDEVRGQMGRRP
jgi:hypothetical protein